MSTTEKQKEKEVEVEEREETNGLAVRGVGGALQIPTEALPVEMLASLTAEIQKDIKSLSVENVTSAKSLLGKRLSITDAFIMTFAGFAEPQKNDDGTRVVFEVTDDDGIVYTVAQNPTGSRLTVSNIFNNVRQMGRKLTLTDCYFSETGKPKAGNKPIILAPSDKTQYLWR